MIRTIFILLAVLWMGAPVSAKGKKAPKSQLKSFHYSMGGGMRLGQQDEVSLKLLRNGKRQLTLRGDCFYERITFEVGEDVFRRCESIILATKLYQSKGNYQSDVRILDAPSHGFSATYTDSREDFDGSGDMPHEIWEGMEEVIDYLKSLRGDRHAPGHLAKTHYDDPSKIPNFSTTVWTNGVIDYTPDESGFGELAEYLNGFYGLDDKSTKWNVNVVEGNGMRCLTVSTYFETHMMEVFVDKSKLGVKLEDAEIKSDSWPQVSQRMLTRGDLDKIPTDSLLLLEKEIYNHYYPFNITSTSNDLEQQNANFISCYIEHRTKKERQNRNGGTQSQGSD